MRAGKGRWRKQGDQQRRPRWRPRYIGVMGIDFIKLDDLNIKTLPVICNIVYRNYLVFLENVYHIVCLFRLLSMIY